MGSLQAVTAPPRGAPVHAIATPAVRAAGAMPWIAGGALLAAAATTAWLALRGNAAPVVLAATGLALVAASIALLASLRGIAAVRRAVHRANDGSLDPVDLPALSRPFAGSLAAEYNVLARNLGSLFGEMEQAQLATIAERNRNEAILQSLPGALLVVDGDLQVVLSNRQAESLFGRPASGLVGANVFDLLHTDEAGRDLLRDAFLQERQVNNSVVSLDIANGPRQLSLNLTFFQQSPRDGQASAAIILQDITDWKRLEDQSRQAEKLVAIGQLAAGVAHELNTPLGTILGYARLMDEGKASEEKRAEYARIIHGETRRCARIIDDLLAFARRDVCQAETCEINGLIRDVAEAVSNCQGRRHCVTVRADVQGEITVRGGQGQLDIVLVNLLVNAVQATSGTAEPRVAISSAVEGGRAVVSITDNGPGVAPEDRARIFEPFFTTKSESSGTGLGLPISHSIVSRLGGGIHCDPAYQGGARFVLTLPVAG